MDDLFKGETGTFETSALMEHSVLYFSLFFKVRYRIKISQASDRTRFSVHPLRISRIADVANNLA